MAKHREYSLHHVFFFGGGSPLTPPHLPAKWQIPHVIKVQEVNGCKRSMGFAIALMRKLQYRYVCHSCTVVEFYRMKTHQEELMWDAAIWWNASSKTQGWEHFITGKMELGADYSVCITYSTFSLMQVFLVEGYTKSWKPTYHNPVWSPQLPAEPWHRGWAGMGGYSAAMSDWLGCHLRPWSQRLLWNSAQFCSA